MYRINKASCDLQKGNWCNKLDKNPKNYLFSFLLALIMNYILPVLVFFLVVVIGERNDIASYLFYFFSSLFPGMISLYFGITSVGIIVIGVVIVGVDLVYIAYMITQVHLYTIIPISVEVAKWVIILFFPDLLLVAAILSLIPFMAIAVGSHFLGRVTEDGGLYTRNP